jgi:hypothetical protein
MAIVDTSLKAKYRQMLKISSNIDSISNNTIFYGSLTGGSNLGIKGYLNLQNDITMLSNLYISGNSLINNLNVNNNLFINNNNIINGNLTINSNLYILKNIYLNKTTNLSNFIVSGYSYLNNVNSNLLSVSSNTIINNNLSVNSNIYISGNANITNTISINSNLYCSNNSIINGNTTIFSYLGVSNTTLFNLNLTTNNVFYNNGIGVLFNNTNINSNLYVSNLTIFKKSVNYSGNLTVLSNLNVSNILNLNGISTNSISISNLAEYNNNNTAYSSGTPLWGFYRTGDILKIRVDVIAPVLTLSGNSNITIAKGQLYVDPGVGIVDNLNENIIPYITSISYNSNNYLLNSIPLLTSTTVSALNTSLIGTTIITYTGTDSYNNSSSINRTITIVPDNIYPTITLNGGNIIKIPLNSTYTEYGVTITNYLNQSLTPIITGSVNTAIIGKYLLTYTVSDYYGNTSSVIRTVYVLNTNSLLAYQLNNPNTYLYLANNYNLISNSQYWTIESWVYLTSYSNTQCYDLIDFRNSPNSTNFVLIISNSGLLGFWYGPNNSFNYCPGSINIPLNTWTHIVYHRNGIFMDFYINGTFVGNLSIGTLFDYPNINNLNQITLGHSVGNLLSSNDYHLQGSISQLKISIGKKYSMAFIPNNDLSYDVSNTLFLLNNNYYDNISDTQMTYPLNLEPIKWNRQYLINLTSTNIESRNLVFNLQVSNLPSSYTTWMDTTGNYGFIIHPNANNFGSIIKTQNNYGWKRSGNIGWTMNTQSITNLQNQSWVNGFTLEQWLYIDYDFIPSSTVSMLLVGQSSIFNQNDYGFIFNQTNFPFNTNYGNILAFSTNIVLSNQGTGAGAINLDALRGQGTNSVISFDYNNGSYNTTNGYLTTTNYYSTLSPLISGDFTCEVWIYYLGPLQSGRGTDTLFDSRGGNGGSGSYFAFGIYGTNGTTLTWCPNPTFGNNPIPLNAWTHLAWVRNSTTNIISVYINGSLDISIASPTTFSIGELIIGNNDGGLNSQALFRGYISQSCISSYQKYINTFTPNSTISKDTNTIFFLGKNFINTINSVALNINGTVLTGSYQNISNLNSINYLKGQWNHLAVTQYIDPKSISYYNTINGNLYSTSNSSTFSSIASGDFTCEVWVYFIGPYQQGTDTIFDFRGGNGGGISLGIDSNPNGKTATWLPNFNEGNISVQLNTWTHLAWVRTTTFMKVYVNGVLDVSLNFPLVYSFGNLILGNNNGGLDSGAFFRGYISQACISSYQKYTSSFTPTLDLRSTIDFRTLFLLSNDYKNAIDNSDLNVSGKVTESFRYNANNSLNIYVNGGLVITLNSNQWNNWSNPGESSNPFTIGCNSNNGTIDSGSLNKVHFGNTRMYNRMLYQDEIINNYTFELPYYQIPTSDIFFIKSPNNVASSTITAYDFTTGWLSQTLDLNKLRIASSWTIECWAYATSWGSTNDAAWILDLSNGTYYLAFGVTTNNNNGKGTPFIYYTGDSVNQWKINTALTVPLNQWNHLVWQKNNDNNLEMFLNGVSSGIFNINANDWKYPNFVSTYALNNIIVGASTINLSSSTNHWKGKLSQVKITLGKKYTGTFISTFDLSLKDNGLFLLHDNFINNSIDKSMNNNNVIIPTYSFPTITLNGSNSITLYAGIDTYTELGAFISYYTRTLNITQKLTGTINTSIIGNYNLIYTVIDSLSNMSFVKRYVNIIKYNIPPVITLIGAAIISIYQGSTYTEQGVNITNSLGQTINPVITGSVDTLTVGQYILTYTATDSYDNIASITRLIYVSDLPINGLYFWLDPSLNNTITTNSSNQVTNILDVSGNGIIMYNNVSTPKISTNTISGLPVLDFTNSSAMRSVNAYPNSLNITVAVIVTYFQNTNFGCIWGHYPDGSWDNYICIRNTNGTNNISFHTNNDDTNVVIPYIPSIQVMYIGVLSNGVSRYFKMINLNTGQESIITGTNPLSMGLTNCYFWLGSLNSTTTNMSLCYVGEVMYWKRILNSLEIYNIENYLFNKWGYYDAYLTYTTITPILKLNGESAYYLLLNGIYVEQGITITSILDSNLTPIISGSYDSSTLGSYTITYTLTYGNNLQVSINRTINVVTQLPPISYDITNGFLGPLVNNYNSMNGVDWTIEIWLYQTSYINNGEFLSIFDFRGYPPSSNNAFTVGFYPNNKLGSWNTSTGFYGTSSLVIPLNVWVHVVWMSFNNNLYCFVNGICNLLGNNVSWLNNMSALNSLTLGIDGYHQPYNGSLTTRNKFYGQICQPLITLGAKYNIAGFTPQWDLKPSIYTNILFWLENDIDIKSSQTIYFNYTVITNFIVNVPILPLIKLNGISPFYILIGSAYTDFGVTAATYLTNSPLLPYITSITDINGNQLMSTPILANTTNIISDTMINTTNQTTYTITYSVTDVNGTSTITRIVNTINLIPPISYDITAGYLGPLTSSNISNKDWTIECWINQTAYSSDQSCAIFDFRFINPYYETHTMVPYIYNNGTIGIWAPDGGSFSATSRSSNSVTLNKWTHIVWMRANNNIYAFINGVATLIATNPSWINTLYSLNSITLGVDDYWQYTQNALMRYKFVGQICQPLVLLGAKYSTTGFTPVWNLRPTNMINALFWLDNGLDINSNQTMTLQQTVVQKTLLNPPVAPVITLNGNNPYYQLKNSTFTDPGATAINYLTGTSVSCTSSGTVNTTTLGTYTITYSATNTFDTSTATRTIFIVNTIPQTAGTVIPTITLNGLSTISLTVYSTYTEPGVTATNVFGDIIVVTTTGTVNINQLGTNIITYTASNIYGTTTATRTININLTSGSLIPTISLNGPNPYNILLNNNYNEFGAVGLDLFNNRITTINSQITYDVTNGWLGPLVNNYNSLNSVDWTIEAWIYSTCKNDNNAYVLFDFRSYPYVRNNSFCCAFYPDLTLAIWNDYNNNWYGRSTLKITNNVWNHIVWMRKNQTLYIFINGVVNILGSNDPWMTNLTGCNSLTISADNVMTTQYGSTNTRDKYTGQICQPLITLGAKYNILGFTPQWDLTPSSFSQNNILFWINNGKDVISNQNITLNNTVIQNTLYYSPIGSPVYTVTGTVNNSIIGQNILSYSVTDAYGKSNSITRLVNIVNSLSQISYNTNNGWFGPLVNNYNSLNSVDWTIEAWIYSTCISSGNDAYVLFDFRSYPYVRNNAFCCLFYTDNSVALWNDYNNNWYGKSTIKFSNNVWNHIVWMRKGQTLYIFVNGVVNILGSNDPWINNLTGCNSLTLSTDNYWMSQNGSTTSRNKFLGQICQPLITLGAKYNITGFTPTWDLTPSSYSNVLFWLQNSIDCITNKTLPIVNTIVQNTLTISPIIPILNLNGNSSYSILINSTYIDPGCTAKDYITGTILTVNIISIKDSSLSELLSAPLISTNLLTISNSIINTSTLTNYIITYSTSNSYGTNTITRTVNIVNSINNTVINYDMNNGWFNTIYNNNLNYINYANNWTIETWINPSNLNNSVGGYGILFDFRNGNTISSSNNGKIGTIISINNSGAILLTTNDVNLNQFVQTLTSNLYLPNNKWSHMTIINNNNNLYTFINGILDSVKITPTSLANNPSITLCVNVDYLPNPPMTTYKFRGLISQPLITSNVKYNLNGFYPQWNLQPSNYNNVLFWLNNGIDVISGQNIVFNGTIIQSIITNPYLPNITLNGNNPFYILLNSTFTDPNSTAKDILGNTLSVISSGTVNTSQLGQNIITYSTIDSNNNFNSIIRTVNVVNTLPQISYNLNNGYLGPLQSSITGIDYTTLWTVDTTFEAWINVTQYPIYNNGNFNGVAGGVIIDFRNTNLNNNGINNNSAVIALTSTGYLYSWQSNLNYIITNNQILLNQWTHIVFMRFNNKFYTFINGVVSSPLSFSGYTNLSNNTSISLGLTADYIQNNSSALTYYKFYGSINQASVQLGAKYSIGNFTPSANLQPQSFTSNNKFFLGSNGIDLISGKAMSNTNVVSSIILPTITLNGPNNLYVYLNNTYNELGAIATDSFGNTLTYTITGTVNNSIVGTYILTYTASNTNGITSINRNIFITNITNTNIIVPSISYIQNALDLSNCYIYCPTTLTSVSSFTYEVYLYLTSYSNNICLLDTKPIGTAAQQTGRFSILITTTGSISIYTAATNTQILLSNNTVPLNIWTHVTIVWTGTILYSLINGVYGGISSSFSGTIGNFQNYMIGAFASDAVGSSSKFNGFISQPLFRTSIVYTTTNFTPTLDLTPLLTDTSVKFFLGSSLVETVSSQTMTVVGTLNTIIRECYPYISNAIDLTNGYIYENHNKNLSLGQFTYECWVYIKSISSYVLLLDTNSISGQINGRLNCGIYTNGQLYIYNYANNTGTVITLTTASVPFNQWVHVAFVYTGASAYAFINGNYSTTILTPNYYFYGINYWDIGFDTNYGNLATALTGNGRLKGFISQPLLRNNIYYKPQNFTPSINLTPSPTDTSVLFYIGSNLIDTVTNNTMTTYGTVTNINRPIIFNQINNSFLPNIVLNGISVVNIIINQQYNELGVKVSDIFNNNLSYTISGNVDITTIGIYTLTYSVTNLYGTASVTRTVNVVANIPIISYDTTNGYLGPLTNNYNSMNGVDWTIECWIYPTATNNWFTIFEFSGYPMQSTYLINSSFKCVIWSDKTLAIFDYYNWQWLVQSTPTVILNTWNHIGWMRSNNIFYVFVNGIVVSFISDLSLMNNLTCMNSLIVCGSSYELTQNNNIQGLSGIISQPLITLGAKYNIKGFTPQWNLRPISFTNVLFWLDNGIDAITGQTITIQKNVIQNTLSSPIAPTIKLNGSNQLNIFKNTTYLELGALAYDYLGNSLLVTIIGSVNISQIGSNTLTYSATQNGLTTNITRTINVVNINYSIIPTSNIAYDTTNGWLGPIKNNYNVMNGVNWTIECWVYCTSYSTSYSTIFDTRVPNITDQNQMYGQFVGQFNSSGYLSLWNRNDSYTSNMTQQQVPLNTWTHLVWMRYNNNFYGFINGVSGLPITVTNGYNLINASNNVSFGGVVNDHNPAWQLKGKICQPLIRLGAKYDINGFIPQWNLQPLNYSNVLLWLQNGVDVISGNTLTLNNTVLQNTINTIPFTTGTISLIGNSNYNILINSVYTEPGAISKSFNNISLPVYITSIKDNNNSTSELLSSFILVDGKYTVIPNNIINSTNSTTYTIIYSTIDPSNGIILNTTRTVNIVNNVIPISYDVTAGYLGPISKNNFNNTNWTIECWVYQTSSATNPVIPIFDFRNTNPYTASKNIFTYINNSTQCIGIWKSDVNYSTSTESLNTVIFNTWSHLVWMRHNNNIYAFINGKCSLIEITPTWINNLINLNSITIGIDVGYQYYNNQGLGFQNEKFHGQICQPLISLGAKYSINGFTPKWDLTPSSYSNILFWLQNGVDVITGNTISLNYTVNQIYENISPIVPIINIIGSINTYVFVNTSYTDLGVTINYVLNPNLIPYITSITDNNGNQYITTPLNALNNNLISNIDTTNSGIFYTIIYSVTYNNNLIATNTRNVSIVNIPINDIFLWLDPSDSSTIVTSSGNLVSINDKSNNKVSMIPYYGSTSIVANGINNLSVISINNTGLISSNTYKNSYNYTLAIVITIYQTNDWGLIFGHYPINNWDSALEFRMKAGTNNVEVSSDSITTLTTLNSTPVLFLITRSNNLCTLTMINLTNATSIAVSQINPISISLGNYNFFIGKFNSTVNYNGHYNVGEIMYWERILTTQEINNIEAYLYSKWSSYTNIKPEFTLNGFTNTYISSGSTYTDQGVTFKYLLNPNLIPYMTSITDSNGNQLLTNPLNALTTNIIPNSIIYTSILNATYTITYTLTIDNMIYTITRNVTIVNIPINDIYFWIDPSDNSTIILDSNNYITNLYDKSSNTINMIHYNINTNYSKINNNAYILPVLDLTNGSGLISSNVYNFPTNSIYTFAGIVIFTSNVGRYGTILGHFLLNNGRTNPLHFRYETNSNVNLLTSNQDPWTCLLPINVNTIPYMFVGSYSNGVKILTLISLVDGTTQTITKTAPISISGSNGNIFIGVSDSNEKINSYVGEEMYWQRLLTTTEQNNIMSYLYLKWSSYRNLIPTLTLKGASLIYISSDTNYTDPGVTITYLLQTNLIPYITSITDINNNQLLNTPINISSSTIIPKSIMNTTFTVNSSLILNSLNFYGSNQYLTRNLGIINSLKWTLSFWIYSSTFNGSIISTQNNSQLMLSNGNSFISYVLNSSGQQWQPLFNVYKPNLNTWINIVITFDSTQSDPNNRLIWYYNNILQTNNGGWGAGGTIVSQNQILYEFANSSTFWIGNQPALNNQFNGYLSQFIFVDNQALTPASFGYSLNSLWVANKYTGSFGSKGFYLDFSNSSNPGLDISGNNNNWTVNNITSNNITINNICPQVYLANSNIIITNGNLATLAAYYITYSVTDYKGAVATLTRSVNVINNIATGIINDWINRVTSAGGNLSTAEINAHSNFVVALQSNNNAWSNILRLNTFCGDGLTAALCPIKIDGGLSNNGASLNDTTQSGTPNYSRTGGMSGTGGAVNTGLKFSTWSNNGQNLHFGLYAFTEISGRCMGVWRESVYTRHYLLCDGGNNSGGWSNPVNFNADSSSVGMNIMQCRTNDVPYYYRRGVKTTVTGSLDQATPSDWPCTIFAANGSGDGNNASNAIYGNLYSATGMRSGGYTIGYGLTDAQVIDITNAFNQLNSELSRS